MKITALSDMHGFLPPIPMDTDLLIVAGDSSPYYMTHAADKQMRWWDIALGPWLAAQPAAHKIIIGGNHDFCPMPQFYEKEVRQWARKWTSNGYGKIHYLQDEAATVMGIKVYGYPWVPKLKNWAFYADEHALRARTYAIPTDTEILVTHGGPAGMGDKVHDDGRGYNHTGDPALREAVRDHLPNLKLHVFGHIHEAYGQHGFVGNDTIFYNVSHLQRDYIGVNPLARFEKKDGKYSVLDVNKQLEGWPDDEEA